jgi:cysteinyl-tRNA synthetase
MIRLYNTLTRKKEDFETLEPGLVKMYVCGVTVYNDAHVGHAMSALVFDIVRRYLEYRGYNVHHVMNFTDVDDKIINRANQIGIEPLALAERYINDYKQNLLDLNILPATSTPRVSTAMPQIIDFIQGLIDKGCAYPASNGDVYFRVTKDEDYGKLSARKLDEMQAGSRIEIEELKEHPMDFALWKAAKPGEIAWDSPWGKGRPGWHIECSAMNLAELGEQIDIHGGGNDLIFPHHENEIAQTESYTGKPFSRYWMHNGMLQLGGEKMSKSLGNMISIKDFLLDHDADVMRLVVLNGSYRAPLTFNDETLEAAEKGLERIKSALRPTTMMGGAASVGVLNVLFVQMELTKKGFIKAMDDDFNTAGALGKIFDLVRAINTARDEGVSDAQLTPAQDIVRELTGIFGLSLTEKTRSGTGGADKFIDLLVEVRKQVRNEKRWAISDLIRNKLNELGVTIEDSKDGTTTWRYS